MATAATAAAATAATMECVVCAMEVPELHVTSCPCGFLSCRKCARTHVLFSGKKASCMECGREWTPKVATTNFGNVWMLTVYRDHMRRVVAENERSLIPVTIARMAARKESERRAVEKIRRLTREVDEAQERLRVVHDRGGDEVAVNDATTALRLAQRALEVAANEEAGGHLEYVFEFPCPNPGCQGLVESVNHICTICEEPSCARCRSLSLPGHRCDENAVKSIELLAQDSKPCPICSVTITKTTGCDQMWCTACKTAFSWNTGQIVRGNIHNPYALEWARLTGNRIGGIRGEVCGGIPEEGDFANSYHFTFWAPLHLLRNTVTPLQQRARVVPTNEIRERFINNEIGEEQWLRETFARHESNDRKEELEEIVMTFVDLATGMFRENLDEEANYPERKMVEDLANLRDYINKTLATELGNLGVRNPPRIARDWTWDWGEF